MTAHRTKLVIGRDLTLPLEAITETIAILGIRGSGKTNTAAVYAEELLDAGQQVVILDPTDAWWGLKSSADGLRAGYPVVVLGGRHADLPLNATDGRLIADFVVEQHASVICSLRGFESKGQELRFATDFLRRLYHLKGQQDTPAPLALILDEASRLVPQRVMGEEAACVGAVQQIVRQGRSSGFGVALIDQRAATVNKDVLAQLEMMVVHRTTGPQDRKALKEWIEAHDTEGHEKEFLSSLASLAQGEAWFWSPGWLDLFQRAQVRQRRTFDSSRTPRAGEVVVAPKRIAEVDLDALRGKLAATIEKAKADDPAELRKEIAALKKQIVGPSHVDQTMVSHKTMASQIDAAVAAAVKPYREKLEAVTRLMPAIDPLISALQDQFNAIADAAGDDVAPFEMPLDVVATPTPPRVPTARAPTVHQNGGDSLSRGQQKILNGLAELHAIGILQTNRSQLGMFAGYNLTGGSGAQHIADLAKLGLIEIPSAGAVALTDAGHSASNAIDAPRTRREIHDRMLAKLPDGQRRILEHLIQIHPRAISRADLGTKVNYNLTGGSGAQHVADLVTLGAAKLPRKGEVVASDILFPAGLR